MVTLSKQDFIDAVVQAAWEEIIADMRQRRVPAKKVHSFSDLHDYVDANLYGGAEMLGFLIGMGDEARFKEFEATDILNAAGAVIDARLRRGSHIWEIDEVRRMDRSEKRRAT
jgi:hypothetical protein